MAVNLLLAVVAFASGGLVARLLGPEGRGELAAIQIWPSFLASLSLLGLSQSVVYFTARRPDEAGRYLTSATLLTLLSSFLFMAMGYVLMPFVLAAQSPQTVEAARWYLLIIPLFSLTGMPQNSLRGRSDFTVWNLMRLVIPLGWVVLLLVASLRGQNDPAWLAFGYLVLSALFIIPAVGIVLSRTRRPFLPEIRQWRPMLGYGLPLALVSIPLLLNMRLDQMLMTALLMPRLLGLYAVAVAWGGAVSPLLSAVGIVLFPRVASQPSVAGSMSTLAKGFSLTVALGIVVGGLVLILTPIAVPLIFGVEFKPAVPPAMVLVLGGVASSIKGTLGEGVRGLGESKVILLGEGLGLAVTAVGLILLLRPAGMIGAATASVLGYFVATWVLVVQIRRRTGYTLKFLLWPWEDSPRAALMRLTRGTEKTVADLDET
jgi:O-antigen/teichoic acid export membrane protein